MVSKKSSGVIPGIFVSTGKAGFQIELVPGDPYAMKERRYCMKQRKNRTAAPGLLMSGLVIFCMTVLSACAKSSAQIEEGWGETQSISVATDWAGIDFVSPVETLVMDDGRKIDLTTYRYKTGIVEALYKGEDYEIVFRRSNIPQAEILTEKANYPDSRDVEMNGTVVHCLGTGAGINIAYYDIGDDHFSIICHMGNNDTGLTENELSVLSGNAKEDVEADEFLAGIWVTASQGYEYYGTPQAMYYVQFAGKDIIYGHMKDNVFIPDHKDTAISIDPIPGGGYIVRARSENGKEYSYRSARSDKDTLEYHSTWDEDEFSQSYSAGSSLSRKG